MIFDLPEMERLRRNYSKTSDCEAPQVILMDRKPHFHEEQVYLENLIQLAPINETKRTDWLHRFITKDEGQHWGAWFEIMLYGWLREVGQVEVAPDVAGADPDFSLKVGSQQIIVEAQAYPPVEDDRHYDTRECLVREAIESIQLPFLIIPQEVKLVSKVNKKKLREQVTTWLEGSPTTLFPFEDGNGNRLVLWATSNASLEHVIIGGFVRSAGRNYEPLKQRLSQKAHQHKSLREAGHPYVIAILLEPWYIEADWVVAAWFGDDTPMLMFDLPKAVPDGSDADVSGLHFRGSEIRHTTVSGTLVFEARFDIRRGRRVLIGRYIQNPYAQVPIDASAFPVVTRCRVISEDASSYKMAWETWPGYVA